MAFKGKNHKGGRPRGKKSAKTLEREKVMAALSQRILKIADGILDKQLVLVRGQQFLYKIEKERAGGTAKAPIYRSKPPELVEAETEIRGYLENLAEHDGQYTLEDPNDPSATYYFITTKEPDNRAIDSIFNRIFGKATDHLDVTSKGKKIGGVTITVKK